MSSRSELEGFVDRFGARQDAAGAAVRLPPQQPQSAAEKASAWLDPPLGPAPDARPDDNLYPDFRCWALLCALSLHLHVRGGFRRLRFSGIQTYDQVVPTLALHALRCVFAGTPPAGCYSSGFQHAGFSCYSCFHLLRLDLA